MSVRSSFFARTLPYRLTQALFAERKFSPVRREMDLLAGGRVLDVACGPGTNARHFSGADYLGVDINGQYIEYARLRHRGRFEVADVTQCKFEGKFDLILVNSFFHHVDDASVRSILSHLHGLLEADGHIHILDLVLPRSGVSAARLLTRLDRGDYARPLELWRSLFGQVFEQLVFEPYRLGIGPMPLWNMVYFKGRRRQ